MAHIGPLAETADTVTLRRADFEALVAAAEDVADRASFAAFEARVARDGMAAVKADSLTLQEAVRILDEGESPVRVWREKRGLTGRALAAAAGVSPVYLSEIENGKKPGSAAAIVALAKALQVDAGDLLPPAATDD
ncbi:helix-turn-helix domain-containing protein [Roseomonas haemaphysalidis]|uniref:Helix-turn-helix transcriptional regulator n=1 Tax=Roseomonas haemaphysalidis TaxID=2768162 RepID=A0ABS3KW85_9PROT|nr:helix-turn-helix transcriptional regulator [Roseomonas haemaphysalidis]MBO1081719.1 helix-turn-helix transcriptional regulator [Roseomonas haemaphysalidis]